MALSLRQSGKRCYVGAAFTGTVGDKYNVRNWNTCFEPIDTIKVGFANWRCNNSNELAGSGTLTVRAYIEYPAGVITQLTFAGGNPVGTIASGDVASVNLTLETDLCQLPFTIPAGAVYWLRWYWESTTGQLPFTVNGFGPTPDLARGDAVLIGANVAQGGAMVDGGLGMGMWPAFVASMCTRNAYAIIGDSRCYLESTPATVDATGDIGEVPRAIGGQAAYLNLSRSGSAALFYATSNFQRQRLLSLYCDRVIFALGINDFAGGQTAANVEANRLTIRNLNPTLPHYVCTVAPYTSSTDGWTTVENQTPHGANANRVTYNNNARAGASGFTGTFDLCSTLESGLNSGKWAVGAGGVPFTGDGLHANTAGCQAAVITLDASHAVAPVEVGFSLVAPVIAPLGVAPVEFAVAPVSPWFKFGPPGAPRVHSRRVF